MMDEDGMLNDNLRKYVVEYVVGATLSLMYFWLENDDSLSAEEIAVVANLIRNTKIVPSENAEKIEGSIPCSRGVDGVMPRCLQRGI